MSWRPQRKVAAAGTVAPFAALIAWALPDLPSPVTAALAVILAAVVAYFVPSAPMPPGQ